MIRDVLKGEVGARVKVYEQTCMRCGACAKACHFSLSHPDDASYTPVAKLDKTIFKMVRESGKLNAEQMRGIAQIAHTECNMCRRCIHYCPVGVDIAYLMSHCGASATSSASPRPHSDTANSHSATSQMWVRRRMDRRSSGRRGSPRDSPASARREGADFMYSVIARAEVPHAARLSETAIFHQAGGDYGVPRLEQRHVHGRLRMMGRIKRAHFELAQKLRVKRIVMGECGHAFRSVYDQGNRWLAWKDSPVPVVHAIEFYWELINEGKIKITHQFEDPVTIHDPCNTIRGRGLADKLRDVVHFLCANVVEMTPNREHNFCCSAGGGIINCGPPFKSVRMEGNRVKADQLRNTGSTVVAPAQLPRRTGRHHQALQARHAHQVHRRPHL
ncbi:MAG: (Fe-S)-binding protein [Bilophila wadsworthia]